MGFGESGKSLVDFVLLIMCDYIILEELGSNAKFLD